MSIPHITPPPPRPAPGIRRRGSGPEPAAAGPATDPGPLADLLAERLDAAFGFRGRPRRAAAWTALVRRLAAGGAPVPPGELDPGLAGIPAAVDGAGRIRASLLGGEPTAHRIRHRGGAAWAWCVFDALLAGILLDGPVRLESTCPAAGAGVGFVVDGDRVLEHDPADLVSLPARFTPGAALRAEFCCRARLWAVPGPGADLAWLDVPAAAAVAAGVADRLGLG